VLDSVDKCPTVYAQTPDGCPPVVVEVTTVVTPAPAPAPAGIKDAALANTKPAAAPAGGPAAAAPNTKPAAAPDRKSVV
jgi:hypothetical protein